MKPKQEIIDVNKSLEAVFLLLKHLTDKEKELIANNSTCLFLAKGEIVYGEGDIPEHLICLVSGQVKIYKEGIAGRDWIARMVKSVEVLGYRSLFGEDTYTASAKTIQDSIICKINKDAIFEILKKNPDLMFYIMKLMARELGFVHAKTITLTQKHIRGRLAETLLFLRDTYGFEDDMKTLKVYLSREDLANLSNMTTSNAIRTLSAFNAEKLIGLDGRKITLLDEDTLEKVSRLG